MMKVNMNKDELRGSQQRAAGHVCECVEKKLRAYILILSDQ